VTGHFTSSTFVHAFHCFHVVSNSASAASSVAT
jgi:hypothetical protein